ncbi:hypothetical protein BVG16_06565 [Paenibacillus selenitireducens]|uniref:Uncharacterized protein n=1 Tax=Paenibacillus selenitireducens TaxID=1324314 RepID=A0A1T2XKQ4_9BACL|nr:hypothetical protein BVG16_06565 [Paenibacillus selenitireducens]
MVVSLVMGWTLFCTTGCWDRVEIDERGFVVGVGIDIPDEQEQGAAEEGNGFAERDYLVTYQLVVPSRLKRAGSSGSSDQSYFNITLRGDTLSSLTAKLSSKTSRSPFFEHLQVVIVSDQVARREGAFSDIMDYFVREKEMRRSLSVMVSNGKAKDILNIKPPNEEMPTKFIHSAAQNTQESSRMLEVSRLGKVHASLLKRDSFLIQLISITKEHNIFINGSALFDGRSNRFIGFLDGEDTAGTNYIRDLVKGGVINAKLNGQLVAYGIERVKRKMHAQITGEKQVTFYIDIHTMGTLEQIYKQMDITKKKIILTLEDRIDQDIARITNHVVKILQQDYGRDVLELGAYLSQEHYAQWEKIKDNWEEGENLFSKSKIIIKVNSIVKRTGNVIESEKD